MQGTLSPPRLIQVVCPARMVTGGPESLHNLARLALQLGHAAEIVYWPLDRRHETPAAYLRYGIPVGRLRDEDGVLAIFPEIYCMEALAMRRAVAAIWWLSVNNFAMIKYHSFRDRFRYLARALRGQRPWLGARSLRALLHLTKAQYDRDYLRQRGIVGLPLAGPISDSYLGVPPDAAETVRGARILYNPLKDRRLVPALIERFPEFEFVPLRGLDESALRRIYRTAMLYVDFGNHPGKERMPREAAISGCCVITGRRGSAANDVDVPLPARFKLDESAPDFMDRFAAVAREVIGDYDRVQREFEPYREIIRQEPALQAQDLQNLLRRFS